MPRHPLPATSTSPPFSARIAACKRLNTLVLVRLLSSLCSVCSQLNGYAVLVGIIARLALWRDRPFADPPSAYTCIFHSRLQETRNDFDLKANLPLVMVFLFDFDHSPLAISLNRLICGSNSGFALGALWKILLYESLDYEELRLKQRSFAPIATAFKSVTMFALDLLADICGTSKRMQYDTQEEVQCDPFTCIAPVRQTTPIDGTQGTLDFELPCQYPHTLDEVVIDGFFYSLIAPYPLSQAPSLYFDMSPSLNGESGIDIPVALDNLRYNLSLRSEAYSKSRIFDGACSGTSSYPGKSRQNLEEDAFEAYSSSTDTAPSTSTGTPVLPLYPPGAFYTDGDHVIELPGVDGPSLATETSAYDISMYPPGAFYFTVVNHLPGIATEPHHEEDHTESSLYPPGAFSSFDDTDLPVTRIEVHPERDETGSSLHPPGAFNSSDVIDLSATNIELQEDQTESFDNLAEAADSSYDGSLTYSQAHLLLDDGGEPFACEIDQIPSQPGTLEQEDVTSRRLSLELQDGYHTDSANKSGEHDPSPRMTDAAYLEEMYDYIRALFTPESNSVILDDETEPVSSTSRALPDFLIWAEPYQSTLYPSVICQDIPTSLAGSDEGMPKEQDSRTDEDDDGVNSSSIPIADQSRLTHSSTYRRAQGP